MGMNNLVQYKVKKQKVLEALLANITLPGDARLVGMWYDVRNKGAETLNILIQSKEFKPVDFEDIPGIEVV